MATTHHIKGIIYDQHNRPMPKHVVEVFDQDLRLTQLLGTTKTNANGEYQLEFDSKKALRADVKTVDVFIVVKTIRGTKELGRSTTHFNIPNVYVLDFKIDGSVYYGLPEFDILVAKVEPLLVGQRVKIHQLKEDDKHQDISFLVGETGEAKEKLELLPLAHQFGTKAKLDPDIFYGLFRMSFPQSWNTLFLVKRESIKEGLEIAIEENIISSRFNKQLKSILRHFDILSSQTLLQTEDTDKKDIQKVLAITIPQAKDQKIVIDTWIKHEDKPQDFIKNLEKLPGFRNGKKIKALQHGLLINAMTLKQPALTKLLMEESQRATDLKEVRGFAKFETEDWKTRIHKLVSGGEITEFPNGIKGETVEEKTSHYAETLRGFFNEAYPTSTFKAKMLKDRKKVFEPTIKGDLQLFFTDNPDFDLETTRIKETYKTAKTDNIRNKKELFTEIKNINRLYKLSPNYEHVAAIRREKLTSASEIIRHYTESSFVNTFEDTLGETTAKTIYNKASKIDKNATALAISYQMGRDIPIFAMQQQKVNLQETFGDNLLCQCNHCQSLYSPAAYFVDLLNFLRKKSDPAYKELLGDDQDNDINGRRPDLQHILLTCKNTNTPLPYIDLVNELLEAHIAPSDINSHQTTFTANQLEAFPEHTSKAAYNLLKDPTDTPLEAFFNLPWEETQAYLKTIGIKRYEVMHLFYGNNGDADDDIHIAAEVLELSSEDMQILYGNMIGDNTPVTSVNKLLQKTGLSYRDMLQMLECQFINPIMDDGKRTIDIDSPNDEIDANGKEILSCDIDTLEFSVAIDLNSKVFRFLRLWKRLGWSMFDVDRTLRALDLIEFPNSEIDINEDLILPLSRIVRLKEKIGLAIPELLVLWHTIDEVNYTDHHKDSRPEIPSLFKRLFQNNENAIQISDLEFDNEPAINEDYKTKLIALLNLSQDESLLVRGELTKANVSDIYRKVQWLRFFSMPVNAFIRLKSLIDNKDFDNENHRTELLEEDWFESVLDYLKFIKRYSLFSQFDIKINELYSVLNETDGSEEAKSRRRQWFSQALKLSIEEYQYFADEGKSPLFGIESIWELTATKTQKFEAFLKMIALVQFRDLLKNNTKEWYTLFDYNTKTSFKVFLSEQSKVSNEELNILIGTTGTGHFGYTFDTFRRSGNVLCEVLKCAYRSQLYNTSSELLIGLTGDVINEEIALVAKNLLKSKYEEDAWLDVIKPISNKIRERKRNALVAYILHAESQNEFRDKNNISNMNDLYAHFLIDLEMSSCMMSSRIKQAISSVQLFIDRCLLGVEIEPNVELDKDFAKQWNTWRKQYRVWEANRKIFLYPENWIEPELRDDKSPFFKDLESKLTQNEMKKELAEEALRQYLEKLDEVANLDIMGLYPEFREVDGQVRKDNYLHVIGRTKSDPHIYFYRKQLPTKNWTAWERIDLDIEGNHILPVVWNNRLILFWGVFEEIEIPNDEPSMTISKLGDGGTISSSNKPNKNFELKLVWSEYKNDKWGRKKSSEKVQFKPLDKNEFESIVLHSSIKNSKLLICSLQHLGSNLNQFVQRKLFNYDLCSGTLIKIIYGYDSSDIVNPTKIYGLESGDFVSPKVHLVDSFSTHDNGYFDFSKVIKANSKNYYPIHEAHQILKKSKTTFRTTFNKASLDYKYKNVATVEFSNHSLLVRAIPSRGNFFDKPAFINELVMKSMGRNKIAMMKSADGINVIRRPIDDFGNIIFDPVLPDRPRPTPDDDPEDPEDKIIAFGDLHYRYIFNLFQHPYVCHYITSLGIGGIDKMYSRPIPNGPLFDLDLFAKNLITVSNSVVKPYPRETLDFEFTGTYSQYNWELFFHIPLLIAVRLNANQKFKEARQWFHYIFDPTTKDIGTGSKRYWKLEPFKKEIEKEVKSIDEILNEEDQLEEQVNYWEQNPFNPHAVARLRISAYMRTAFMKYIDNLIDWADQLFRSDSMESINEAIQLYVLAANLLGEKPKDIPQRAKSGAKSFKELIESDDGLDALSNTIMDIENYITTNDSLDSDGIEYTPYFCTPKNTLLLKYWDKLSDRLFKIRNCMNIEGQIRKLALFKSSIDPAFIVRAKASGLDLNTVLNDIESSLPHYRFQVILQRANELCNDVKSLGTSLLSAIEKKDAEELALLRSGQEMQMLELVKDIRKKQLDESKESLKALLANQTTVEERKSYYESREFMNVGEIIQFQSNNIGLQLQLAQSSAQMFSSIGYQLPDTKIGSPFTAGFIYGGSNIGATGDSASKVLGIMSAVNNWIGSTAGTLGSYHRRMDDWKFQAKTLDLELKQIEKQILAAEIRLSIAEKELENHKQQINNTRQVDEYLRSKFTNAELYSYMVSQISGIYFQSYQMAYDLAKKAEKCMQYELGIENTSFVQFGYWDSLKKGLLSGEKLQFDLRRLELSYLDNNKREFEITKHISLRRLNPESLLILKTKKDDNEDNYKCEFTIPEWLFDIDCPGHYKRRIKTIGLSIPCVTGPYTSVNCKLELVSSDIRIASSITDSEENILKTSSNINSIVTSSAQNDNGMFEGNLRDERYLPFEGAGIANSLWNLELPKMKQFDYNTITDVILHVSYTALDGGEAFKGEVITDYEQKLEDTGSNNLYRLLSLQHDFPNEWNTFITEENADFTAELREEHFPYFATSSSRTMVDKTLFKITEDGKFDPEEGKILNSTDMRIEIGKADLAETTPAFVIVEYSITL